MSPVMKRREAMAALAWTATLPLLQGCTDEPAPASSAAGKNTEADALKMLDEIGENFLRHFPESATSLGIDTGVRAALRSKLADRSADGHTAVADQVRQDLERATAFD